jgi:hypothetical protein
MTTIKPEHLTGLLAAFKTSVQQGSIDLAQARDFADQCCNFILDQTVATAKDAKTAPVRFATSISDEPVPNPTEITLSPKAQEAKARAAAKRKQA